MDVARHRWRNIRSNYLREKRLKVSRPIKWEYFPHLTFLDESKSIQFYARSQPTSQPKTPTVEIKTEVLDIADSDDEQAEHLTPEEEETQEEDDTQPTTTSEEPESTADAPNLADQSGEDEDDNMLFLRSLAPNMRRLQPLDNMEFRVQVLELLKEKLIKP